jgi:putative CocE/NonD family hydrolase
LLKPHPALKVAAPESPMIDGWMGDDWFHYGAFRLANIGWIGSQTGYKGAGKAPPSGGWDDYDNFRYGSAGDWAKKSGYDQLPAWNRMVQHPAYDAFWQGQALDKLLAANPSDVPTLWEQGLWDQEDMYGAITAWEALKAKGKVGNNFLVMGPWRHSQVNREGRSLGPFQWDGDTALQFREQMVLPLFNQYLKPGSPAANLPTAAIYNTGENHWDRLSDWPLACAQGCATGLTPLYLQANGGLGFEKAATGGDRYVSDPAKPVPHLPRPVNFDDGRWGDWLVSDQRHADGRPDVLTYQTAPLTTAVRVSGAPFANLFARTTGTDGDFVVKIIDVFPPENATDPKMGGYQLPVSLDIFRGRYRDSFAKPTAIPAGKVQRYRFRLPTVNHVFQPGHRIMVQVQSSLFPLYDRNPQTFVPNIFLAKPQDYKAATITIERGGASASSVDLPVVPVAQAQVGAP